MSKCRKKIISHFSLTVKNGNFQKIRKIKIKINIYMIICNCKIKRRCIRKKNLYKNTLCRMCCNIQIIGKGENNKYTSPLIISFVAFKPFYSFVYDALTPFSREQVKVFLEHEKRNLYSVHIHTYVYVYMRSWFIKNSVRIAFAQCRFSQISAIIVFTFVSTSKVKIISQD